MSASREAGEYGRDDGRSWDTWRGEEEGESLRRKGREGGEEEEEDEPEAES